MNKRRRISPRERAEIFQRSGGICHCCSHKIDAGRERWEVEHVIPLEMGGDEAPGSDNLQPAHVHCHAEKSKTDVKHIAKGKRQRQRDMGIKKQPTRVVPGSRASRLKKKADGSVVDRETGETVWPRTHS